jgi:hypothetical protein
VSRSKPAGDVLSQRTLNRALLKRQLLLQRRPWSVEQVVEHLVGMQSQAPNPPYIGLWTRMQQFRHEELSALMLNRSMVRIALMRSTIHLVSAGDCLTLRPLMQPVLDRIFNSNHGTLLTDLDPVEVADAGRQLVEAQPRTFKEISEALSERWPDHDRTALAEAVRTIVPLVQVPPRGVWGLGGPAAHTSAEYWLNAPLDPDLEPDQMVRRYLAAFGPASVQDIQHWSRLSGLRAVVSGMRAELRTYRNVRGKELLDLASATLPDPDTPAPVRFIPEFDNLLLSHADRTRIISDEHRRRVFTINGIIKPTVLIDGFVHGMWKIDRNRDSATLRIELFSTVDAGTRAALADEGERLLAFAAADAGNHDVEFINPE